MVDENENEEEDKDELLDDQEDNDEEELLAEDSSDEDYVPPKPKTKKIESVPAAIPIDIITKTAEWSMQYGISSRACAGIVANVCNESGVPLDKIKISQSTANRTKNKVAKREADLISQKLNKTLLGLKEEGKQRCLTLHYDGKQVDELTLIEGVNVALTQERLAIVVSSPYLMKPHVLGVLSVARGTGEIITDRIIDLLVNHQGLDLTKYIAALSFDTTKTNTGEWSGANVSLEKIMKVAVPWCACRHRVYELHICHFAQKTENRQSKGPDDTLFKRLADQWNVINLEMKIDLNQLIKYKWGENLELDAVAEKTLFYLLKLLKTVFYLADYHELLELSIFFWVELCQTFI